MLRINYTKYQTISHFTSTHRRSTHRKSSKQLPNSIFEEQSENFSHQDFFNTAKVEYEDALEKPGYDVDLKYPNNKSEKPKTQK